MEHFRESTQLFGPKRFLFKYRYLETTIVVMIYLFIGYSIYPDDICMLNTQFIFTMFLAIITLFHGLPSGLLAMSFLGVVMKFAYKEFDYIYFLKELVLVMVFGEFHFLWHRKIKNFATELKYTKEKLYELSNAFYTLKLSYDQIERSYVIKPMSLRNSLMTIREEFIKRGKESQPFQKFLTILSKTIDIRGAFVMEMKDGGRASVLAKIGELSEVNYSDILIEEALIQKMPLYVSMSDRYVASRYLAVVPAVIRDRVYGLLVIEKMPFMSFNKDNLSSSAILLNYMFYEIHKVETVKRMGSFLKEYEIDFRFEAYRLFSINRDYKMTSTVLILRVTDRLKAKLLKESIEKNVRVLDSVSFAELSENLYLIGVIFIFAHKSSMEGFMNRIKDSMDMPEMDRDGDIKQMVFSIDEVDLIEKFSRI